MSRSHVRCPSILFLIGSSRSRRQCCPPCRPGSVGTLVLDARAAGFRGSSAVLGRRAGFAVLISHHNGGGRLALGLLPRTPQAPWASHNCMPSAHATSWPVHVRMWIPPGRRRRFRVRRRWKARFWPEPWQGHRQSQPTGKRGRGFTFKWCTHDPLPSLFHAKARDCAVVGRCWDVGPPVAPGPLPREPGEPRPPHADCRPSLRAPFP